MKRPLVWTFLSAIVGVLVGRYLKGGALLGAMMCLIIALTGLFFFWKKRLHGEKLAGHFCMSMILVAGAFFMTFVRAYIYDERRTVQLEYLNEVNQRGDELEGIGKVIEIAEGEYSYSIQLSSCKILINGTFRRCGNIILYLSKSNFGDSIQKEQIGNHIYFQGQGETYQKSRNEGGFDDEAYAYSMGRLCMVRAKSIQRIKPKEDTSCNFLWKCIGYAKLNLEIIFDEHLSPEDTGIARALILGNKDRMNQADEDLLYALGVGHVLAISGLHLSLIGMGAYALMEKLGVTFNARSVCASLIALIFALFTGSTISGLRAVVMLSANLGAGILAKRYDFLSSYGLAGTILLLMKPYTLFQLSFQYSFLAILGVGLSRRFIMRTFIRIHPILRALITSAGAWLLTLPLTLYNNYEVPWVGIVLNIFVIPLMTPILLFLLLGVGTAMVPLFAIQACAVVFFRIYEVLLSFLRKLCLIAESIPFGMILTGKPCLAKCVIYTLLVLICLRLVTERYKRKYLMLMPVLVLFLMFNGNTSAVAEVTMLDVGQGDGVYLCDGQGHHFFIDGGSSDVNQVGKYRILPFLKSRGISRIDGWFISHCDMDHVSGLLEVMDAGYPIGCIYFYEEVLQDEVFADITKKAARQEIEIRYLNTGEGIRTEGVQFICLNIPEQTSLMDKNRQSLVLLITYLEYDLQMLFAGDIDSSIEDKIADEWNLEEISIWKATHHGSKHSNGEKVLSEMKPKICLVSCGKDNRYGHPGEEAIKRMKAVGSNIFYTMEQGQITILIENMEGVK